jgi:hypothetical protein
MKQCECGNQIANNARTCPKCSHRFTSGPVKLLAWLLGILAVLFIIGMISQRTEKPRPPNDAELLIALCGQPTKDDSTEYDNPRPIIPSRTIEYEEQRLRFMFVPGNGKIGDPPPYKWKLIGITDMAAKDPSKARVVMPPEATSRMPCWSKR